MVSSFLLFLSVRLYISGVAARSNDGVDGERFTLEGNTKKKFELGSPNIFWTLLDVFLTCFDDECPMARITRMR